MSVYKAINKVQDELAKTGIAKDKTNVIQNYKFRGIDDIYNVLSRLISDAGLCILPNVLEREVVERQTAKGGAIFYVTVKVEFHFVSVNDPSSKHVVVVFGEAMDSGDKATNKAMSAAYKYACLQVFCIPTEGDNDADGSSHDVASNLFDKAISAIELSSSMSELLSHYNSAVSLFPHKEKEIKEISAKRKVLLNEGDRI